MSGAPGVHPVALQSLEVFRPAEQRPFVLCSRWSALTGWRLLLLQGVSVSQKVHGTPSGFVLPPPVQSVPVHCPVDVLQSAPPVQAGPGLGSLIGLVAG